MWQSTAVDPMSVKEYADAKEQRQCVGVSIRVAIQKRGAVHRTNPKLKETVEQPVTNAIELILGYKNRCRSTSENQ